MEIRTNATTGSRAARYCCALVLPAQDIPGLHCLTTRLGRDDRWPSDCRVLLPGETTLAFYNATNEQKEAVTGISTYNVSPQKAGLYFHKIQCFCFEEQRLLAGETIDMPVFFYIDPDFADDPKVRQLLCCCFHYCFAPLSTPSCISATTYATLQMDDVSTITLSYTFFKAQNQDFDDEEEAESE